MVVGGVWGRGVRVTSESVSSFTHLHLILSGEHYRRYTRRILTEITRIYRCSVMSPSERDFQNEESWSGLGTVAEAGNENICTRNLSSEIAEPIDPGTSRT